MKWFYLKGGLRLKAFCCVVWVPGGDIAKGAGPGPAQNVIHSWIGQANMPTKTTVSTLFTMPGGYGELQITYKLQFAYNYQLLIHYKLLTYYKLLTN